MSNSDLSPDFTPKGPIFAPHQYRDIIISDIGVGLWFAALVFATVHFGFAAVFRTYLMPWLWYGHWLVFITFQQHTVGFSLFLSLGCTLIILAHCRTRRCHITLRLRSPSPAARYRPLTASLWAVRASSARSATTSAPLPHMGSVRRTSLITSAAR